MAITLGNEGVILPDGTTQATKYDTTLDVGSTISITTYGTAGTFTWTKPTGCTRVLAKVVGGGGGAAGYCESGGSGGYSEVVVNVTAVSTVTVTVGAGGAGVAYYAGAGAGGTSSFGAYATASGGNGSNSVNNHTGGHGGIGSGGAINLRGGGGTGHANSAGHGCIGNGGASFWGGGATINRDTTSNKIYNGAPGSGAPGARTDDGTAGAGVSNGETGLVIVYAYK